MTTVNERRAYPTELLDAVSKTIQTELAGLSVAETVHREHHVFIGEWIDEIKRKREQRERIRTHVIGWAVVTFFGAVGTAGYTLFEYLRDHLK